jgi:hypothetical protein
VRRAPRPSCRSQRRLQCSYHDPRSSTALKASLAAGRASALPRTGGSELPRSLLGAGVREGCGSRHLAVTADAKCPNRPQAGDACVRPTRASHAIEPHSVSRFPRLASQVAHPTERPTPDGPAGIWTLGTPIERQETEHRVARFPHRRPALGSGRRCQLRSRRVVANWRWQPTQIDLFRPSWHLAVIGGANCRFGRLPLGTGGQCQVRSRRPRLLSGGGGQRQLTPAVWTPTPRPLAAPPQPYFFAGS